MSEDKKTYPEQPEDESCSCGCDCEDDCDCDGDCDCEPDTITLTLDDDQELECEILDVFPHDGKEYIALLPIDDAVVLIYEYEETDGVQSVNLIDDDELYNQVSETFKQRNEDFEFVDTDLEDYEYVVEEDEEEDKK